ncbi:uncharacterized protein EI90DRAFT_3121868 [Cantharellus anzutake]|uniref:uncharacterized protein n=1 Tax=Cantharellus anzutake TaxID=1750568 RepID=UPI001902D920|nr:uncharacterized protein EI90DRAFT_3121868 [Cantharellus anzutake]KAF8333526.1 hypothetical protein EI90DRAFT_3121868 [Cantharellus anzutake]
MSQSPFDASQTPSGHSADPHSTSQPPSSGPSFAQPPGAPYGYPPPGVPGAPFPYGYYPPYGGPPYPNVPPYPQPGLAATQPGFPGSPSPSAPHPGAPPPGAYPGGAPQPYGGHPSNVFYPPQPASFPQPGAYSPVTYLGVAIPQYQVWFTQPPPVQGYQAEVQKMRKATKGFGTDDKAVISVLISLDAIQMDEFARAYQSTMGDNLVELLKKETSGKFEFALVGLAEGPLKWDVILLEMALHGLGTNETLLNELVLDRTNAELHILKAAYERKTGKKLEQAVADDLSLDTRKLFSIVLVGNRDETDFPNPHDPNHLYRPDENRIKQDVAAIQRFYRGDGDSIPVCNIILNSSRTHLAAVDAGVLHATQRTLHHIILDKFSGHTERALLYVLAGCTITAGSGAHGYLHGIERDAELISEAMRGIGTKDEQLTWRIVRNHWNKARFEAIKTAFIRKDDKTLAARVKSETSGSYRDLLLAIISK